MSSIRLLAFAHRGEARSFLNEFSCKALPIKDNLFHTDNLFILISGEGPQKAMTELSLTLGLIKGLYPETPISVLNLGICGALELDYEIGNILEIRTIYSTAAPEGMEFKSFTSIQSKSSEKRVDLVTAHQRVLDIQSKEQLSNFAPLVDREAWGFAYACQVADVDFRCIKLVSDTADGEICQVIKEQAEEWSDLLLDKYLTMQDNPTLTEVTGLPIELDCLHITISQRRRLQNLFRALELKGHSASSALRNCNFEALKDQKKRSKEITKELILKLNALVYPLNSALDEKLENQTAPLKKAGIQVRYDQDLERELLHLSMTITSKDQLKKVQDSFGEFNFDKYVSLLRGQDV